MKRCLICIEAVCGGYASSNKHSKYHPAVPSPTTLINSSDLCLYIHLYSFFTLVVACNTGKLCWSSAKFAPFHFWGESRMNYIEGALEWISKTFFFRYLSIFIFFFLHFCLRLQLEAWPARLSSARRPSRRSGPTCCCSWGAIMMNGYKDD